MHENNQRTLVTLSGTFQVKYEKGFIYIGKWSFTPGFRAATYNCVHQYDFSKSQARVIARTMGYHEEGYKCASHDEIRDHIKDLRDREADDDDDYEIGSARGPQRLRDLFRNHPAWKTFLASTNGPGAKVFLNFNHDPTFKK